MMMLGVVLHSGLNYAISDIEAWNVKDPHSTSYFFDFLCDWIHLFRMPIFFWISGFFGALLFYCLLYTSDAADD